MSLATFVEVGLALAGSGQGFVAVRWRNHPWTLYLAGWGAIFCGFAVLWLIALQVLELSPMDIVQISALSTAVVLLVFVPLWPKIKGAVGSRPEVTFTTPQQSPTPPPPGSLGAVPRPAQMPETEDSSSGRTRDSGSTGIKITGGKDIRVEDNRITGYKTGIDAKNTTDLTTRGNVIKDGDEPKSERR